jgi:hypothetical protein
MEGEFPDYGIAMDILALSLLPALNLEKASSETRGSTHGSLCHDKVGDAMLTTMQTKPKYPCM